MGRVSTRHILSYGTYKTLQNLVLSSHRRIPAVANKPILRLSYRNCHSMIMRFLLRFSELQKTSGV